MRKLMGVMLMLALVVVLAVPAFAAPRGAHRPGPGGRGPGAGPGVAQTIPAEVHTAIQTATQAAAAKVLGITPEALRQALATSRMAVIAAQKNVALATVQAAMKQARAQTINDLVKAGKLTAAQAEWLLQAGPGSGRGRGARGSQQGPGRGPGPRR